ncbi:hypothetical protein ABZ848_29120 [Streptomyces sp. NPDC047081]|uniref:hypothetical protein n=1 Tax=Streptomyces sp. NPDC047081 TaxID=3154706 RepID=UPI0033FC46BD
MTRPMGVCAESRKGHDMAPALEDRLAVTELTALHGHRVDDGQLDRTGGASRDQRGSVTYEDVVVRVGGGWRIRRRKIVARRVPLSGVGREV